MKKYKLIIILFLVFSFSGFQLRSSTSTKVENDSDIKCFETNKNEVIGKWEVIHNLENSNGIKSNIIEINFKKNYTAIIKIADSIGKRKIKGIWSTKKTKHYEKVIEPNIKKMFGENTEIKPELILEYIRNGKGVDIMTFSKKTINNEILFKAKNITIKRKK